MTEIHMTHLSLANGAPLTADTWKDFVSRLWHDCVGEGVSRHYTKDATFIVEKRVWRCVPDDCSDIIHLYCDGHSETPQKFYESAETERYKLDEACGGNFLEADCCAMREALAAYYPDVALLHVQEEWEFVGQHLTRDAAEAFIKRKGHDYREGLRIYVDATIYSWELNTIKKAILDGRIAFIDSQAAPKEPQ